MKIIDGRKIKRDILSEIKNQAEGLSFRPVFTDVLVGDDPASVMYVKMKANTAESVGMDFHTANFKTDITTEELIKEIEFLNKLPNMCGIIIQLPLPKHIEYKRVLNAIDPRLDVDCLGEVNSDNFYNGIMSLGFPAALACMELLNSLELDLKTNNVAVLGQGLLVGKPVTKLLQMMGLTPEIITRDTKNNLERIKNADIIISGIGQAKYINGSMIKKGAIVIDAGASELDGSIVGDVDLESVRDVASYVSPVPGGVGPTTVAMLFKNVLQVANKK